MTTHESVAFSVAELPAWVPDPGPVVSGGPSSSQLRARVSRPNRGALVLAVHGEVDAATVEHLHEVLWPRLSTALATIVLELTEVGFLGVSGLALVHRAHLRAQARGLSLGLVPGVSEAARAVHISGLDQELPCFATAEQALRVLDRHS